DRSRDQSSPRRFGRTGAFAGSWSKDGGGFPFGNLAKPVVRIDRRYGLDRPLAVGAVSKASTEKLRRGDSKTNLDHSHRRSLRRDLFLDHRLGVSVAAAA